MTELYDFPADHVGRKSYVTVRGHDKSVPKFKTYVGTDRHNYLLPDFGGDWSGYTEQSTYILPDKLAYLSPMDRTSHITSRSTHREHMKRHGAVEAGDRPITTNRSEASPMGRSGGDIVRALQELRSR